MYITEKDKIAKLQLGESPIKDAPLVPLSNGESCIPQHYLLYQHDRVSVEKIVLDIEYSSDYPIFVGENQQGIYIQLGIVGRDNYPTKNRRKTKKLVYGRKWRVEPMLPTSEIIQTVFLALKTGKEHEIRELFRLEYQGTVTTPFNNHHDLPVLARLRDAFKLETKKLSALTIEQITEALSYINYDYAVFKLLDIELRSNKQWIVDIGIYPTENTYLAELLETSVTFTLVLPTLTINLLYQYLMEQIILLSNTHIEEHFKYNGFNRFSKHNDIRTIAELSVCLRHKAYLEDKEGFINEFEASNYDTDRTRVPSLYQGDLSDKIKKSLDVYPELEGFLPETMTSKN